MITAPLSSQLAREEAARRRQSIGFWAGLWLGISLGAAIGTLACAVAA